MSDTYEFFHYFNFWQKSNVPLSKKHIGVLQNAVFNIFFNSDIKLDEAHTKYFTRHNKNLKLLASKHVSDADKQEVIHKHGAMIKKVGNVVISYLDE